MAMKQPARLPVFATKSGVGQPWNAEYAEFANGTYVPTDRSVFVVLASAKYNSCLSKYAQIVAMYKETEAKVKFLREVIAPAITIVVNQIAKSGDTKLILEADRLRTEFLNAFSKKASYTMPITPYFSYSSKISTDPTSVESFFPKMIEILSFIDLDVQSLNVCMENIKDSEVPATGMKSGVKDCGYWARVIWLFDAHDFSIHISNFVNMNNIMLEKIAAASAAAGSLFDIDDKLNGANSYRNKNKQLVAKEEFEEEQKQKQIAASKAVFEKLVEAASTSPIATFINQTLANIVDNGAIVESVPVFSKIEPTDNILVALKKRRDNLLADIAAKKFDNAANITDFDIETLASLCGNAYTEEELRKAIKTGVKPTTVSATPVNLRINAATLRLARNAVSALSTNSQQNAGGKTPAELAAEAEAKRKEEERAKLEAEKKALEEAKKKEDAEKIAALEKKLKEAEQKVIDADIAAKEAEEKKKKEAELAKKLEEKGQLQIGLQDMPKVNQVDDSMKVGKMVNVYENAEKEEKLIFGLKPAYAIGGGIAAVALLVILTRKD